ncbi:hypothetical protein HMN09_00011300 [Mycena chlorophos]|uniref:Uncharacterized protein n=1 Tax=Mycena chlorophos TaxID=658473 RepID=A0A8H6WM86_MYCCL|nr:hypothetical protein HMN09_00011300 [Mycena chlorophos]
MHSRTNNNDPRRDAGLEPWAWLLDARSPLPPASTSGMTTDTLFATNLDEQFDFEMHDHASGANSPLASSFPVASTSAHRETTRRRSEISDEKYYCPLCLGQFKDLRARNLHLDKPICAKTAVARGLPVPTPAAIVRAKNAERNEHLKDLSDEWASKSGRRGKRARPPTASGHAWSSDQEMGTMGQPNDTPAPERSQRQRHEPNALEVDDLAAHWPQYARRLPAGGAYRVSGVSSNEPVHLQHAYPAPIPPRIPPLYPFRGKEHPSTLQRDAPSSSVAHNLAFDVLPHAQLTSTSSRGAPFNAISHRHTSSRSMVPSTNASTNNTTSATSINAYTPNATRTNAFRAEGPQTPQDFNCDTFHPDHPANVNAPSTSQGSSGHIHTRPIHPIPLVQRGHRPASSSQ